MTKRLYDIPYLQKMDLLFSGLKRRSIELLEIHQGDTVAEIGCGTGEDAIAIAKLGAKVYGVDHDPEMIAASTQNSIENLDIEFLQCEAAQLPLPDGCVDKIRFDRVFQHLDNYDNILLESYRVLKAGGQLQIIDPDYFSFIFFLEDVELERKLSDHISYKRIPNSYKIRQVPNFLRRNGFDLRLTEVHNYLIKDYELAISIVLFEKVVAEEHKNGTISPNELLLWNGLKERSDSNFNFSMNLVIFNAIKI